MVLADRLPKICHRCGAAYAPGSGFFVVLGAEGEGNEWTRFVCRGCASFIGAAIDGRPLFSRGERAKFEVGPEAK